MRRKYCRRYGLTPGVTAWTKQRVAQTESRHVNIRVQYCRRYGGGVTAWTAAYCRDAAGDASKSSFSPAHLTGSALLKISQETLHLVFFQNQLALQEKDWLTRCQHLLLLVNLEQPSPQQSRGLLQQLGLKQGSGIAGLSVLNLERVRLPQKGRLLFLCHSVPEYTCHHNSSLTATLQTCAEAFNLGVEFLDHVLGSLTCVRVATQLQIHKPLLFHFEEELAQGHQLVILVLALHWQPGR